ncbi:MAG: FliM/FliN family flagellar motor switch protein, partial [Gemmobacter sp.]|nr:FliM/FliN family flagellar motor switch protein [Gemmobacter sp.]
MTPHFGAQPPASANGGTRRKIGILRAQVADAGNETAARAWRLGLARAARDEIGLPVAVRAIRDDRRSLAELLELPPERALLAVLEGPGQVMGLLAVSPELLASMIEMQTVGAVANTAAPTRRPTRTDAAMSAALIDRALTDMETTLATASDLVWAGGFRYASFLEDARPLGLLLEDVPYRVLIADLDIAEGRRTGRALLALPAEGRGPKPSARPLPPDATIAQATNWSTALTEGVLGSGAMLEVVIGRVRLPLAQILALTPGAVLPLGSATLDSLVVQTPEGMVVATGRHGQNR